MKQHQSQLDNRLGFETNKVLGLLMVFLDLFIPSYSLKETIDFQTGGL